MRLHETLAFLCFVTAPALGTAPVEHPQDDPLHVCATLTDLGDLARQIGGEYVRVTVFAKGVEDAHFVEARPSFIKELSDADLYIEAGMELEMGWAPLLLANCRNARVQPGAPGYLDISKGIRPLDVPAGTVDRSMGDVHARGNPHYLLDPLNGLAAARMIHDRLVDLHPAQKSAFDAALDGFKKKLGAALVGEKLAELYDFEKLALLDAANALAPFLAQQKDDVKLGGWLGALAPYRGVKAVADHNMWPYMAARFHLDVVGFMEPLPGVPPTTRHLADLVEQMKQQEVKLVLSSPYYDPRHARFVSEQTGARIVAFAHQVGSRPGTGDYLAMIDYNVKQLLAACSHG
jgi:ABC-type Zn uptake system ZnuABC Zn-binding protein ZnuA